MPAWLCSAVLLLAVLGSATVAGGEPRVLAELTLGATRASSADDPAWGWWDAAKYDQWQPVAHEETGVAAARLTSEGDTYSVLLAAERYPTLRASASWVDPVAGPVTDTLRAELEVYDLALGQRLVLRSGASLTPWVGLTFLHIGETRKSSPVSSPLPDQAAETADTRLWGALLGVDGHFPLVSRLAATVRLAARWGRGTREARLRSEPVTPGGPEVDWVRLKDSTSRAMYGAELGLSWQTESGLELEAGWRYRDWRYDNGPGSFDGAFVRLGGRW